MARHRAGDAGPTIGIDVGHPLGEMGCAGSRQAKALARRQIIRPLMAIFHTTVKILVRLKSSTSSHLRKDCRAVAMHQMQCLLKQA